MTQRERMLATIYGKPVDSIPWAPRMDLWYIANQAKGTLPDKFAGLNTVKIARDLNVACHSVRADFTIYRSPREHLMLHDLMLMDQFFYFYHDNRDSLYKLADRMVPFFEAVCTQPMTQCKLAEVREGMGPKTTVWGGIPSIALLDESMDEYTFKVYLDDIFRELGSGERLIFGVSDNVPPDANLSRLEGIKQRIEDYGPVHPA